MQKQQRNKGQVSWCLFLTLVLGKWRQRDLCGLLASQFSPLSEFQNMWRPYLKKK